MTPTLYAQSLRQLSLLHSLREAAAELLARVQHATQQALIAVDWPAAARPGTAGARPLQPAPSNTASFQREEVARQLLALRFAAQDWLERSWQARVARPRSWGLVQRKLRGRGRYARGSWRLRIAPGIPR